MKNLRSTIAAALIAAAVTTGAALCAAQTGEGGTTAPPAAPATPAPPSTGNSQATPTQKTPRRKPRAKKPAPATTAPKRRTPVATQRPATARTTPRAAQRPMTATTQPAPATAAATAEATSTGAKDEDLLAPSAPNPKSKAGGRKMIIIVADKINLKELNDPGAFPNFTRAVAQGALGLMVTGTPGGANSGAAYATIGAGGPAAGSPGAGRSYNINRLQPMENGQTVYEAYMSRSAGQAPSLDSDTVLNLALPPLMNVNRNRSPRPGALGEMLWKNGYSACVYGNADFDGVPHREAALITMNSRGQTPHGDVDQSGIEDVRAKSPFTASPDLEKLKDMFYEIYMRDSGHAKPYVCDLIVVEFGDTSRAEAFQHMADAETAAGKKRQALERLDHFLGFVVNAAHLDNMRVVLLSPSPPASGYDINETMTPVLMVGGGIGHGLLTSSTTRTRGVVSNIDIAPGVLDFFGIAPPNEMRGAPPRSAEYGDAVPALLREQFMDAMRLRMGRLQQTALFLSILIAAAAFLTAMRMPRVQRELQTTLGAALCLSAAQFPALMIASVIFTRTYDMLPGGFNHYILYFAACTAVIGGAAAALPRAQWRVMMFVIIYVLLICADIISGGMISRGSVLASSPQLVLRFYGIESALAGLLAGAALAGCGLCLDMARDSFRTARWPLMALLALVAFLIGTPTLGANTGCLLAACVAFTSFAILVFRRKFGWTEALYGIAAAAVLFCIFAAAGVAVSRGAHLPFSRTLSAVRISGDLQALPRIALWRIASNLRLLRNGGSWAIFFSGLAVCATILCFFPNNRMESLFRRFRRLNYALLASLAGAAAAFALVYPGVVPAAVMLFIPTTAALILCINPSRKHQTEKGHRRESRDDKPRGRGKPEDKTPAADKPKQPQPQTAARTHQEQPRQQKPPSGGQQKQHQQGPRPDGGAKNSDKDSEEARKRRNRRRGGKKHKPAGDGGGNDPIAPGMPPAGPKPATGPSADSGRPRHEHPSGNRSGNRYRGRGGSHGGGKRLPPDHPDKGGDKG